MKWLLVVGLPCLIVLGCVKKDDDQHTTRNAANEFVRLSLLDELNVFRTNNVTLIWHDEDGNKTRIDDATRMGMSRILDSCVCRVVSSLEKRGLYGMIYKENGMDEFCIDLFEGGVIAINNKGGYDVGPTIVRRLVDMANGK